MPHTLIVADDLSGAADCAIAFAGAGETFVALTDAASDAAVLAIDADTRRADVQDAAAITTRLFANHARPGMTLFKKLDSTLRGHIGVEIAAACEGLAALDPLVILTPAFPTTGRVLRQGRLTVNGVALEDTEMGREIAGNLTLMLLRAGLRPAGIAVEDLRADVMAILAIKHDVLLCDAETDADLATIVAAGRRLRRTILWAGSGGLARHLGKPSPAPKLPPLTGNILFGIGSQSEISRAQATHLAAMLGEDVLMQPDAEPQQDACAVAQAFARQVAPAAVHAGALVLTGGETAHEVLIALNVSGLHLLGEIEPGVIVSRAEGGPIDGRIVVTKAGAFGTPDTLVRVRTVLRGLPAPLEGITAS